jgi:hypothetical protein
LKQASSLARVEPWFYVMSTFKNNIPMYVHVVTKSAGHANQDFYSISSSFSATWQNTPNTYVYSLYKLHGLVHIP